MMPWSGTTSSIGFPALPEGGDPPGPIDVERRGASVRGAGDRRGSVPGADDHGPGPVGESEPLAEPDPGSQPVARPFAESEPRFDRRMVEHPRCRPAGRTGHVVDLGWAERNGFRRGLRHGRRVAHVRRRSRGPWCVRPARRRPRRGLVLRLERADVPARVVRPRLCLVRLLPGSAARIVQGTGSGTLRFAIDVLSGGWVRVVDSGNGSALVTKQKIATGRWVRLEWFVDQAESVLVLRLFHDGGSANPTESTTSAVGRVLGGPVDRFQIGRSGSQVGAATFWTDEPALSPNGFPEIS